MGVGVEVERLVTGADLLPSAVVFALLRGELVEEPGPEPCGPVHVAGAGVGAAHVVVDDVLEGVGVDEPHGHVAAGLGVAVFALGGVRVALLELGGGAAARALHEHQFVGQAAQAQRSVEGVGAVGHAVFAAGVADGEVDGHVSAAAVGQGVGAVDDLVDQHVPVLHMGAHVEADAVVVGVEVADVEAVDDPTLQVLAVADHLDHEAPIAPALDVDGREDEAHAVRNDASGHLLFAAGEAVAVARGLQGTRQVGHAHVEVVGVAQGLLVRGGVVDELRLQVGADDGFPLLVRGRHAGQPVAGVGCVTRLADDTAVLDSTAGRHPQAGARHGLFVRGVDQAAVGGADQVHLADGLGDRGAQEVSIVGEAEAAEVARLHEELAAVRTRQVAAAHGALVVERNGAGCGRGFVRVSQAVLGIGDLVAREVST